MSKSSSGEDDLRYPRPQWVNLLRRVLRPWWVLFFFYFTNVSFNLLSLVINEGPQTLFTSSTLKTLLLGELIIVFKLHPVVVLPSLAVILCFILLGRWSHKDQERERSVLDRRKAEDERKLMRQRQDEIEKRLSARQTVDLEIRKAVYFLPYDLPDVYIDRQALMEKLRGLLLGSQGTLGSTIVVHGMGGSGKTVLARTVCNDPVIRDAFPEGILWETVGQNTRRNKIHPKVAEIQQNWISALGGDISTASSPTLGKVELQTLLGDRAVLLVLDDVWHQKDIAYLKVVGQRCKILVTTRDSTVADTTTLLELGIMSVEESRELLKIASKGKLKDDALVDIIAKHLGYLPLAIDIVARLLADGVGWGAIERALHTNIEKITYGDRTLAAIITSISLLGKTERERYYELIVFPQDERIPEGAVTRLWKRVGLEPFDTSLLLDKFRQRALLQDNNSLHDILHSYLLSIVGIDEQRELHNTLVNAYNAPSGWRTFPTDGEDGDEFYFWRRIGYHLNKANRLAELHDLLANGEYLKAKLKLLGVAEVLLDYTYLPKDDRLQSVAKALQLGAQVLSQDPDQLRNQIYGRLGTLSDISHMPIESEPSFCLDSPTLIRTDASSLSSFKGHKGSVFSCSFSPAGQLALSASADSSLRMWDINTGENISTFEGHLGAVNDCVFTQDGQMIISASDDTTLRIWDTSSGRTVRILQGHTGSVRSCALSPDGKIILSASADKSLRLWNSSDDKSFLLLQGHWGGVNCCAFHPGGQSIASGADDSTVKLWNVRTGQPINTLEGHTARILSCNFNSDGTLLASSSEDKTIRIWDVESGQAIRILEGHTDFVNCCTFNPDGKKILSASSDYTLRVWDITTGQTEQILSGHNSWVNKCCFSQDGKHILSASYDGSLRLWSLPEGITTWIFAGNIRYLRDCAYSLDGKYALSACADGSLQLWDALNHTFLRDFRGHRGHTSSCAFSPTEALILSGSADTSLRLWDFYTAETLRILEGHKGPIYQCVFSPDGTLALSASSDQTLLLWDIKTGEIRNMFQGHLGTVRGCAFSPDGKLILSSSWDNTLRLWDAKTGETIHLLQGHYGHVRSCAFSPDGKHVLSASYDSTLKLWDVGNGKCLRTFSGHTSWVFDCLFTLDGHLFISVSDDRTMRLWRVEEGDEIARWVADAPLTCCDMHCDGKQIICGDSLGNLHFLHWQNV